MSQTMQLDANVKDGLDQDYIEISNSSLFDSKFYLSNYPDVDIETIEPLLHFLRIGYRLSYNPHPLFDMVYYREQAGNLIKDQNPLLHFLRNGNHLELSPHPYFDTKFYLSKYPDLKKGTQNALVHFIQHGAREYRWPNAAFDPLYYLRIVPQAYADNFLIHYLEIGHPWQVPTIASSHNHPRVSSEIISLLCRSIFFTLLCLVYSYQRHFIDQASNYDHQFSSLKFFRLAMLRFWQGNGLKVKINPPTYLMQPKRLEQPQSHQRRFLTAPLAFLWLYFANVLKYEGFFADARFLLDKLSHNSKIQDLALCSLGDLMLVEAIWAHEFKSYAEEGIVLNLFPQWKKTAGQKTWHDRNFDQAVAVIKQSIDANEKSTYAQWLLCYGLLAAGKYADALLALYKYSGTSYSIIERDFLETRARYGLEPKEGVAFLKNKSDEDRYIADLELINVANVPASAVQEHVCVLEPTTLPIESKIMRNLEFTSIKSTLQFDAGYLSRFKKADILPEYGAVVADNKLFIKESNHMKLCHASLFNSCLQEITDSRVLLSRDSANSIAEENCIYIGCNNNYYHWLIDELPRLSLVEKSRLFTKAPLLIDDKAASWQCDLLTMLGVDKDRLRRIDFSQPVSIRNLVVPSRMSRDMVAHPQAVSFMRKKLIGDVNGRIITKGKRIYVTRTAHTSIGRVMLNELYIIAKFKRAGFQIIEPAQLSIQEQIEYFSDADVIAGPTGAGLTNILFAPRQARILSLGASQAICETYTSLASAIGQESWSIRGTSYPRPYPNWIWTNFDYEIDEKDIDLCFDHIL